MHDNYNAKALKILALIRYATVATVTPAHKPWNSPVAHYIDKDFNIYWFSNKDNQHSVNIRSNPDVYIVIYDSTAPIGSGEGVYIEASAKEVSDIDTISHALSLNPDNIEQASDFIDHQIRRCYQAIPQRMWMNDAEVRGDIFIRDYKVELDLLK